MKKIILAVTAVVLAAAIGGGVWWFTLGRPKEPVKVFSFNYLGMTEYWGDNQESYGPVTTDRIQTVYISETQTVTQVHVEPGAEVKKGDLLLSFDTTLSDLALERKRLDVEKLRLQLLDAEEYLKELKNMRPMRVPQVTPDDESEEQLGALLTEQSQVSFLPEYDGSSADKALILWVRSDAKITDAMLEEVWSRAVEFQTANRPEEPVDPEGGESGEGGEDTGGEGGEAPAPGSGESSSSSDTDPGETPPPPEGGEGGEGEGGEGEEEPVDVSHFYVVIKVTASNRELGNKSVWQGLHVYRSGGEYSFQFFSAPIPDHMLTETDDTDKPDFDYGSGYT
ncbi:MAG: biotin/lipoyl-binding protein, partial [Clostridia bacterium]|nr:biotin/lipoyl-binding protein [Clostridia bacterium]